MTKNFSPFSNSRFPSVSVTGGKGAYQDTLNALAYFDLSSAKNKKVLLKPNAGRIAKAGKGITTEPQVVAAAIDAFQEAGAIVDVGESPISGVKALEALEATGITEVSVKRKCRIIDLDARKYLPLDIPNGIAIQSLKLCADILDYDIVVSMPVIKMHMHTGVTLSVKNMKGCLWRRSKVDLHMLPAVEGREERPIDIAIADMSSVLRPHFVIIDGSVGMEGLGPSAGQPKEMGAVIVGDDPYAADAVACRLIGMRAEQAPHLLIGAERGFGVIDLNRINIQPDDWESFETPFEPPPKDLSFDFPDFNVLDENSCSACQSSLLLLLKRYGKKILEYYPKDRIVDVAIGKGHQSVPEGTLCLGNCARKLKDKGIYVPGCPPVSSQILRALTGEPIFDSKDGHSEVEGGSEEFQKDE